MRTSLCRLLFLSPGLLLPGMAFAAGYSLDIEMVHPHFSPGGVPTLDTAFRDPSGTVRAGTLLQFEKDPLVILINGEDQGAVVANRIAMDLGVSYDVSRRIALRLVIPTAASFGGSLPDLGGDSVGLGDAWLGARIYLADPGPMRLALRADLGVPTGNRGSYLGEGKVRFDAGFLADARIGPIDILADVGANFRGTVATEEDLSAGSELDTRLAVRYRLMDDKLGIHAGIAGRGAFNSLYQGGGGNSAEILGGVQLMPTDALLFDVGFGKGVADGYGSTDFRILAGFTYSILPPKAEPEVVKADPEVLHSAAEELPEVDILPEPTVVAEPPKVQWKEGELARVEEKQIIIRDPIQFEEGNANILPESLPILKEVARLMNENGQIGFMVVEGHASNEGSFEYNYDLSNLRARSIWQALIEAGVHPARLGYRGMGEVQPVVAGDTPEAKVANRRVVFSIVRQYQPGDTIPELPVDIYLPWNGQAKHIDPPNLPASFTQTATPPPPPPPPPPQNENNKGLPDANIFRQDDDEDQNGGGK